jgi:hypothetical protein
MFEKEINENGKGKVVLKFQKCRNSSPRILYIQYYTCIILEFVKKQIQDAKAFDFDSAPSQATR